MVSTQAAAVVRSLHHPLSLEDQITNLRRLKNDIIGHDRRKEEVVKLGVVDPLVRILLSGNRADGKRRLEDEAAPWTQEHEVRLQATLVLSTLAAAGPPFLHPLCAAHVPKHLLAAVVCQAPARLVTASLQALRSLLSSNIRASHNADVQERPLLSWFDAPGIEALKVILLQPQDTSATKQQFKLCCEIVTLAAVDDKLREALVEHGLVDTLASLLASHAIAERHFDYRGSTAAFPPPPSASAMRDILIGLSNLVGISSLHMNRFVQAPAVCDLIAGSRAESSSYGSHSAHSNPAEHLIPPLHVPSSKVTSFNGSSSAFPALSSLHQTQLWKNTTVQSTQYATDPDYVNAVFFWVLHIARSLRGVPRLSALRLLSRLHNVWVVETSEMSSESSIHQRHRERVKSIALLAIPLAVDLVQVAAESKAKSDLSQSEAHDLRLMRSSACEVLGTLINDNREFQQAAVEAGATKRVCEVLKESFEDVDLEKPMWSPQPKAGQSDDELPTETSKLGSRGLPNEIRHAMRCRKSALWAIATLTQRDDLYRKAMVESGIVSCIIDSLKPFPPDALSTPRKDGKQLQPKDGNTSSVIHAACHAARSLSRSVSLLRTSLIDAGIAVPIFALLKHPDLRVRIAATDVCCNLLLDFSPMREDLLRAGVIKTLTEHAKQNETNLRLASLWALKHLVLANSREVKLKCLEELGSGWLVSAIQGEQRETYVTPSSGGVSVGIGPGGLSTPNAAGEQVDLLNPSSMDVDEETRNDDDDELDDESNSDGEVMYDEPSNTHYQASSVRSTLRQSTRPSVAFDSQYLDLTHETELNAALRSRRDEIAVQEQALDFIRNLLNGDDCAAMLGILYAQIGDEKLFALLTEKLAPLPYEPATTTYTSAPSTSSSKPYHNTTPLILSTIHVLTHIANADPTHRTHLTSQRALLAAWLPHFAHPDRRVRVMCVWAVNSLTWVEDEGDKGAARSRAQALRDVGIERAVRALREDPDLDVRERVRTAMRQLEGL